MVPSRFSTFVICWVGTIFDFNIVSSLNCTRQDLSSICLVFVFAVHQAMRVLMAVSLSPRCERLEWWLLWLLLMSRVVIIPSYLTASNRRRVGAQEETRCSCSEEMNQRTCRPLQSDIRICSQSGACCFPKRDEQWFVILQSELKKEWVFPPISVENRDRSQVQHETVLGSQSSI